jgi:predicted O-linked N-acetylglucosamine transferase (SPINDLY family)
MSTVAQAFDNALKHHQAGDLRQAEEVCREILNADGQHVDSLHLLGLVAYQSGRNDLAVDYIGQAVRLQPNSAATRCNLGLAFLAQGKLDEAAVSLLEAIRLNPQYVLAHNNLGSVFKDQGKLDRAVASWRHAIRVKPDFAEAHSNLGAALLAQGKPAEATASLQQAVRYKPDYAGAHCNLGIAFANQGKLDEAVASYRRAVHLKPDYAAAHNYLGMTLVQQKKLDEAAASFRRALALQPNDSDAHFNLATVLKLQGKPDEAAASYQQALRRKPDFVAAHVRLGLLLAEQGKPDEAATCYRRALELRPDDVDALYNLGSALKDQGLLDEAVASWRQALRLKPDLAEAHNNIAVALMEQGKPEEAVPSLRLAVHYRTDYASAYSNLGTALKDLGQFEEAVASWRQAVRLRPGDAATVGALLHELQHECRWEDLTTLSQRVVEFVDGSDKSPRDGNLAAMPTDATAVSPFVFFALPAPTTASQQLRCAQQWVDRCIKTVAVVGHKPAFDRPANPRAKITIGYVSADFHAHATAYLIAELLEKHDRDRFRVFGYSYGPDDRSPIRRRLIDGMDRFVDLRNVSNAEAARGIAADEVDILVDLKGHSRQARTQIFAYRPAPIQVNYLGYPGTMGAPFMDYILVDDFIVPADQQPFFTEKLVHLPGCYQVNDSQREISARTPSRAECGLPDEGFVFCCFNNGYKITPAMFDVWMDLLKAVPGSVLWLLEVNRLAPANLGREAEARGVAAQRLVFAPRQPLAEHLARHRAADLFLDCFPVNAHTTASDALWTGLPLLTIAGETFVSRVAGSLLRTVGLPELITTSLQDYADTALRLARDPSLLGDLRAALAESRKTSRLFDGDRFARSLEQAFVKMWETYAAGEPPRALAVNDA